MWCCAVAIKFLQKRFFVYVCKCNANVAIVVVMQKNKKTIIFDLGGVILDIHVERSFTALAMLGISSDMLVEKNCLMNENIQLFDRGDISAEDFFAYVESCLSDRVRALQADDLRERVEDVWNLMLGDFSREKLQAIKELRAKGYRVVMLSNTNEGHWTAIEKRFSKASGELLEDCFDALYLSYRMHMRKPEKEIFLELMRCEGVTPQECVFYDDSAENCEAARSVGIEAVLVERNSPWGAMLEHY